MSVTWLAMRPVQAWTLKKGCKGCFIDPLVDTAATFPTAKVSCGLFKLVLFRVSLGQELVYDLNSGQLLGECLMWTWLLNLFCLQGELRACLLETVLNGLDSESLVYPESAHSTLVPTAMGGPSMLW